MTHAEWFAAAIAISGWAIGGLGWLGSHIINRREAARTKTITDWELWRSKTNTHVDRFQKNFIRLNEHAANIGVRFDLGDDD